MLYSNHDCIPVASVRACVRAYSSSVHCYRRLGVHMLRNNAQWAASDQRTRAAFLCCSIRDCRFEVGNDAMPLTA